MPQYRISEAAELLGVSDDTIRRWIDTGRLISSAKDGPQSVDGKSLAELAIENAKQLTGLKNAFAIKYQELQKNGQFLSQAEIGARQQELAQLEKNYTNREQQLASEMQEESFKRLQEVKQKIEAFLVNYNKNKEFAYIFSSNPDLMYYKDTAYDITADIVKGLNAEYKPKK